MQKRGAQKWLLGCTLGALLLSTGPSDSAPSPQELEGCRRCDKRGVVDCPKHDKELLAMEARVQFCSVAAACPDCQGAFLVDCEHCDGGPDSGLIAPRQLAVAEWNAKSPMAQFIGKPVARVETEHFHLIVNTGDLKEGKKKVKEHILLHRVADDCEHVATSIAKHYGLQGMASSAPLRQGKEPLMQLAPDPETGAPPPPREYFSKMRMWIWDSPEDHKKVMREVLHSGGSGDFKLLGREPAFSVWTEDNFSTVPAVRSVFAHNAAHMLISNLYDELWIGDLGGGWFDAGVGHWYEYEIFDRSTNACLEEATLLADYHNGIWRAAIKQRLRKEETYFLPKLLRMNTGAMELHEQALCWSFYDWLVAEKQEHLPTLLRGLQKETPSRDLIKATLGTTLFATEDAWRAWVEATYPSKEKKRRR